MLAEPGHIFLLLRWSRPYGLEEKRPKIKEALGAGGGLTSSGCSGKSMKAGPKLVAWLAVRIQSTYVFLLLRRGVINQRKNGRPKTKEAEAGVVCICEVARIREVLRRKAVA